MIDPFATFNRERERFEHSTKFVISVSKLGAGRLSNISTVMASYAFTRMCIGANTVCHLLALDIDASTDLTLDHYSISVLARNVIESALMFLYLSEDRVSDDDWALRGRILDLHDMVLKLRLFKSIKAKEQYQQCKEEVTRLRDEIKRLEAFKKMDIDWQERLLSGHELYVGGLRSTLGLAGFEGDYFDGMYAYLSSQVHVSPTSFYKSDRRLSFRSPSHYQYYFASYALAHARMFLLRAALKLANSVGSFSDKIDASILKTMAELAEVPFGD